MHLDAAADLDAEPGAALPEQQLKVVLRDQEAARRRRVFGQYGVALIDQAVAVQHSGEVPEGRELAGRPRAPVRLPARFGPVAPIDSAHRPGCRLGLRPARLPSGEGGHRLHQAALDALRGREQTAPVEDLGAGDVDRSGLDGRIGFRQSLQNRDPHSLECQLRGEQEAGGPRSDDDHSGALHGRPSFLAELLNC